MRTRTLMLSLVAGGVLAGCDSTPHENAISRREQNLQRTGETFMDIEARRYDYLYRTTDRLEKRHQRDMDRAFVENPERVERYIDNEFNRWELRQPLYEEAIIQELQGDPQTIDRTLPDVLW